MEGDNTSAPQAAHGGISIHALRVEGDIGRFDNLQHRVGISIHALRVEGDVADVLDVLELYISIHALRVEGDESSLTM